ncbi:phosphate--AMP phosphotransferase [Acinetobacter haemolyticus]|uniref:polyphosphate:AMP phosphotransferase n=1 Tax=Acinetobacter haemolyticus TaxID=29430 RepID=UPI000D68C48D|nr:phosphate--AMP phosphotransferase [Acinetobacter haemolyticus]
MNAQTPVFELRDEDELSLDLIEAQYALRESRDQKNAKSVLVLVSGIELAGKGEAVKQLREWLDPRYLKVKADVPLHLSSDQAFWQPYTRFIPAEGQIVVMFGTWYSDLLATAMQDPKAFKDSVFDQYVQKMRDFENDLRQNHVHVIKVWFDLSWKALQKRLDQIDPSEQNWHKLHGLDWRNKKQYDTLQSYSQRFIEDWSVIHGEDEQRRDQCFAQYILQTLQALPEHPTHVEQTWQQAGIPSELVAPDQKIIEKEKYKDQLNELTRKVAEAMRCAERNVIIAFEGMDAAGKGGAIKRIVKKLDPREYEIHTIAAPEPYELRRPYLWRFWNRLNDSGKITIFDRTWYGRVLVERIEGFASTVEWQRAYDEINRFEQNLTDCQTVIVKIWLAISKDEQERRFKEREQTLHKRFKITEEDWRNRDKWDQYLDAAADMFERTSTPNAPWHVIATDDKYTARIEVLKAILKQLNAD